uniref:Uncharacterized protein n=1 Tax=Arundo donax TaxID=35708 RepID=A0A0A9E6K1_ARUDO
MFSPDTPSDPASMNYSNISERYCSEKLLKQLAQMRHSPGPQLNLNPRVLTCKPFCTLQNLQLSDLLRRNYLARGFPSLFLAVTPLQYQSYGISKLSMSYPTI